mmetsp:Transcript_36054/g.75851  ORF Transcript_36054/g.75851 Transcript_36054/m.75851 type:complete len:230 (+) Transcript_36054:51-740(+)
MPMDTNLSAWQRRSSKGVQLSYLVDNFAHFRGNEASLPPGIPPVFLLFSSQLLASAPTQRCAPTQPCLHAFKQRWREAVAFSLQSIVSRQFARSAQNLFIPPKIAMLRVQKLGIPPEQAALCPSHGCSTRDSFPVLVYLCRFATSICAISPCHFVCLISLWTREVEHEKFICASPFISLSMRTGCRLQSVQVATNALDQIHVCALCVHASLDDALMVSVVRATDLMKRG